MNGIRHRVSLAAASLTIASLTACASQPTALPVPLVRTALAPAATSTPVVITPTASPSPTALPTLPLVPTLTLVPSATPIPSVFLVAGGDVMLARQIGDRLAAGEVDYPFALVAETLRSADIAAVNLECAISDRGESLPKKAYRFRAPPSAAASLTLAGIDVVTLANNHVMDNGPDGLNDTLGLLNAQGIAHVGAGTNAAEAHAPAILERNGLRIAFLGYVDVPVESGGWDARSVIATDSSPGLAWADLDQIASDVSAAKARADLVVVLMHSGFEYWDKPNRVQVEIAHTAIDAGAALVIGAHSHTLQGIEHYHGGAIAYSLGNFVFEIDQSRDSAMLKVNLSRAGVESLEWIPVVLDPNDGRPMIAEGEARQRILDSIERLSADLTGGG